MKIQRPLENDGRLEAGFSLFVQPTSQQHIQHDPYVKSCVYLLASSTQSEVRIEYTGGNQRELARQKNLKKQQKQNKGKPDLKGMSVNQKKEK